MILADVSDAVQPLFNAVSGRSDVTFLAYAAYLLVAVGLVLATYVICFHFPKRDKDHQEFFRSLTKDEREERKRIVESHNATIEKIVMSHNEKMQEIGDACHELHRELARERQEESRRTHEVLKEVSGHLETTTQTLDRMERGLEKRGHL